MSQIIFLTWLFILGLICYGDISRRHINNNLVVCLALLGALLTLLAWQKGSYALGWWLILQPLSVVIVGFGLFVFGICGAGDVKLLAAISIAIKPEFWLVTLLLMCILGGLLALGYLLYGVLSKRLAQVKAKGLPYGLAIAASGGLAVYISQLSAS